MQDLKVIGVENGALLVASADGERFRIAIDEVLQSRLRQSTTDTSVAARKLTPREIQDQIRSGMSAEDIASVTGMDVEYVAKYEGPILAEREHIVLSALEVPVHTAMDTGPIAGGMSFGTAIRSRLSAISAINERWASWKDQSSGWVVKLSFTADHIDHDARWSFDPRRSTLSPLNGEATTLSQQGDVPTALVPRLRVVGPIEKEPDNSRFDSGAFVVDDIRESSAPSHFVPRALPVQVESNQTADLLDALRRRRGEREAAAYDDDPTITHPPGVHSNGVHSDGINPTTGAIRIVDIPMPDFGDPDDLDADGLRPTLPQPTVAPVAHATPPKNATGPQPKAGRKGRMAMPSWDDIVFGARPDDDGA